MAILKEIEGQATVDDVIRASLSIVSHAEIIRHISTRN